MSPSSNNHLGRMYLVDIKGYLQCVSPAHFAQFVVHRTVSNLDTLTQNREVTGSEVYTLYNILLNDYKWYITRVVLSLEWQQQRHKIDKNALAHAARRA